MPDRFPCRHLPYSRKGGVVVVHVPGELTRVEEPPAVGEVPGSTSSVHRRESHIPVQLVCLAGPRSHHERNVVQQVGVGRVRRLDRGCWCLRC